LVSSVILSNISPVFRAMFSNRFTEGQGLSKTEPKTITLEEDKQRSLEILLRVSHFRTDPSRHLMRLDEGHDFVTLCDKYDCLEAMRPTLEHWVSIQIPLTSKYDEMIELANI
ncbi:hypothetical protein BDZ85DRAFT_183739, partial [Elsinoe ampelina]